MPSTWLRRGIDSCLSGQWTETFFWGAMLAATALMALQICFWLAGPLYYPGFCASRTSGRTFRMRSGGMYAFFNRLAAHF
ncbi:MAG: hypothetical protein IIC79_03730 [Chloroflexi bacterium]|nr:hypothetical protein [Chloroflexota bacterium]